MAEAFTEACAKRVVPGRASRFDHVEFTGSRPSIGTRKAMFERSLVVWPRMGLARRRCEGLIKRPRFLQQLRAPASLVSDLEHPVGGQGRLQVQAIALHDRHRKDCVNAVGVKSVAIGGGWGSIPVENQETAGLGKRCVDRTRKKKLANNAPGRRGQKLKKRYAGGTAVEHSVSSAQDHAAGSGDLPCKSDARLQAILPFIPNGGVVAGPDRSLRNSAAGKVRGHNKTVEAPGIGRVRFAK